MASTYLLVGAVVVACFSASWFGLNLQPFTLNTFRLQRQSAPTPVISFYKLSLQWPSSTCSSGKMTCQPPTPVQFTIHGIWPQDINDIPVPPYDRSNPCTTQTPTPASELQVKLAPIQPDLESLWPNLKNPQSFRENLNFWIYEWNTHGTCSDYPTQPLEYFNSAVQLRKGLDPDMGLTPGSSYTVQAFSATVQSVVGFYPEIACNRNKVTQALQLWEIRLCYQKPTPPHTPQTIQDCPKRFSGECTSLTDLITFPI